MVEEIDIKMFFLLKKYHKFNIFNLILFNQFKMSQLKPKNCLKNIYFINI